MWLVDMMLDWRIDESYQYTRAHTHAHTPTHAHTHTHTPTHAHTHTHRERSQQKNFQLIIITHDENFVEHLGHTGHAEYFYRVSKGLG